MIKISSYASSSAGNLYSVDDGRTRLLLECGLPIREIKKALNFNLSSYSGCLLSHEHQDHGHSAKEIMEAGIDLFCSRETSDALALSGHRLHVIQAMQQFKIDSWTILPLDGVHDVPVLGFLIMNEQKEKLLFLIDTAYCKYRFKNLKYIMLGVNYQTEILKENVKAGRLDPSLARRIMQTHFNLENALDFLKLNVDENTEIIHVLHTSSQNADKEQIKKDVQKATGKLVLTA